MTDFTHIKYVCRACKAVHLQSINKDKPEETPIPTCCKGSRRDMAFAGCVTFIVVPGIEDQPIGLRAALRVALGALESARGNINPERGFADVVEAEIEDAIEAAREELEKNP